MYTMTLADGTKITNLRKNGTNWVSPAPIDPAIFEGTLSHVTIADESEALLLHNAELIQQVPYEDGWYLAFRERTKQELVDMELSAKIAYLAMMTGVEI